MPQTDGGGEPLRSEDLFDADCPVRPIFDDITSRWATLVLVLLMTRPRS